MIYTLTLNPAIDCTVFLDEFRTGEMNRAHRQEITPGGKGVNVSLALKEFGIPGIALGFVAGHTGKMLLSLLQERGIKADFIETACGETRINIKMCPPYKYGNFEETEINSPGPEINADEHRALIAKVSQLSFADTLILSGNAPGEYGRVYFDELLSAIKQTGCRFIADLSGSLLSKAVRKKPWLIKPNKAELEDLTRTVLNDIDDVYYAAEQLLRSGRAENVLASLGSGGAVLASSEGTYNKTAPAGEVVSTVGAGDTLLAGFIAAVCGGASMEKALEAGVLAGSRKAFGLPL